MTELKLNPAWNDKSLFAPAPKPMLLIGIDPGNTTGVAFWYKSEKDLMPMQFKTHVSAILYVYDQLKLQTKYLVKFKIEDARKQKRRPDLAVSNRPKEQGVGSVKARSKDWEDLCIQLNIEYKLCEPKHTIYKNNPVLFEQLTGIKTLKGQDHLRDSAMLVFGY